MRKLRQRERRRKTGRRTKLENRVRAASHSSEQRLARAAVVVRETFPGAVFADCSVVQVVAVGESIGC
jgi:hypothetical protein